MQLRTLVECSNRIAQTGRRLEKTALLAALLKQAAPEEIEIAVLYLSGRTSQAKTGIGYRTLQATAAPPALESTLSLSDVDRRLDAIAATAGAGSESRRRDFLRALFDSATDGEQRFLQALLVGELRQGSLEGLMADAVAKAAGVDPDAVRRAAMMAGDIAPVARAALTGGAAALDRYGVELFRPVQPMLAQTAGDIEEAIEELGEAALEYKMDGARVQAHKSGDRVVVFSRGQNDVSASVPEVVEAVRALPARELILDGETLSLLPDGRPRPFQVTMRRFGRKRNVAALRDELPLTPYWFDLIYLDGSHLLNAPQSARFDELARLAPQSLIPGLVTGDAARAAEFLDDALRRGHEGVMAKARQAPYAAGARGQTWLKVKRARTLDLVILAAEWGSGRRKGWLSNLHLGARDTGKGGFAMLGKTFKGLTDQMLEWQTRELLAIEIARDSYTVHVEPKLVAEIAFNEIQVSTRYPSGLALRFARVKRYRPDKTAAGADTFETVQRLAASESLPR